MSSRVASSASSQQVAPSGLAAASVAEHFAQDRGELLLGGQRVSTLLARFGSPLFVYDSSVLDRRLQQLRQTLPDRFQIYYSVKANPNQAILRRMLARGCGLEIASIGELHQALAAGCSPDRIVFAGPGKTEAELSEAVNCHLGEVHVESLREGKLLAGIAQRASRRVRISLRVNPSEAAQGGAMRMGGRAPPFGIDEEQLPGVVEELLREPSLHIAGLHLFVGTQILDADVLAAQYQVGLAIARRLAEQLRRPLETLDFGGGLGVPYFAGEEPLDLQRLRSRLDELMASIAGEAAFASTQFLVEPGRFLVAEAGVYLARVLDVKRSRDKTFVVTDGGMHHHLAASGNLGQTIKRNFPLVVANKLDQPAAGKVEVVGPLCTPLDVLARQFEAPAVEPGDIVAVLHSGAYARTASPLGFLSHSSPAEVLVGDGQARLIRRRGRPEDYLVDQTDL